MDEDFYADDGEEEDVDLGYEIPELKDAPPPHKPLSPLLYFCIGLLVAGVAVYAWHGYELQRAESDRAVYMAQCQAQASAALASQNICEKGRLITEQARLEEVNVTQECWERLKVCQDQAFELAGLNVTSSNLKKDRERLMKELEAMRLRLEKLQEGMG